MNKIKKYIFEPVIEDGKHEKRKAESKEFYSEDGSSDMKLCLIGTSFDAYIYRRTEEEVEIPDPPQRKKLCVEIEYDDIYMGGILTDFAVEGLIDNHTTLLNTKVKEIEPGWTDEDMIQFAWHFNNCGDAIIHDIFNNFKKGRNK